MRENVFGAARQILSLFTHSVRLDSERRREFETDLKELIAPHMPVLAHRRAQLLESCGPERWSDELDAFMRQSLWPFLGADLDYAQRNRAFVTLILDVTIEREQWCASQDRGAEIPLVSGFNTSCAG